MKKTAGIKSLIISKARAVLRRLWRWYMGICTVFGTLVVVYFIDISLYHRYRYVELPNGARLAPTQWFSHDGGIVLKNSSGEIVEPPNVTDVRWNEHYVKGMRWVPGQEAIYFIYKVGAPRAVESGENAEEYERLRELSGTSTSGPEQGFLDLIQIPEYRRTWYE